MHPPLLQKRYNLRCLTAVIILSFCILLGHSAHQFSHSVKLIRYYRTHCSNPAFRTFLPQKGAIFLLHNRSHYLRAVTAAQKLFRHRFQGERFPFSQNSKHLVHLILSILILLVPANQIAIAAGTYLVGSFSAHV